MNLLKETNFTNLGEKKVGKVRAIYIQSDKILLVSTDRHSSFDRIIAHIPYKGQLLNQISAFWFDATRDIIPNHVLEVADPNVLVARKCTPLPIEMVVRGYMTGVTGTSLWVNYSNGQRDFGNFTLPDGMVKNQKLEIPVINPTTKSNLHDAAITPKEILEQSLVSKEVWDEVVKKSIELFIRGREIAEKAGFILVDTKYEFGLDENGKVVLIDEIHTPDSSRFWQKLVYEERFAKGEEPDYFDKEFLRLWFKDHCDPYKDEVLPEAPAEMVTELSNRYIQIYEGITGKKFEPVSEDENIIMRMENNLNKFKI